MKLYFIFLIVLVILIFLFFYQIPSKIFDQNESLFFSMFDTLPIYIIHQSEKYKRKIRFEQYIEQYFSKNPITIVEPLSIDVLKENLDKLYEQRFITKKALQNLKNHKNAIHGSMTYSALSLALTNMLVYKIALERNQKFFLVLEDDFVVKENFFEEFHENLEQLRYFKWDILYLSSHSTPFLKKHNLSFYQSPIFISKNLHGMGAVIYKARTAKYLLENMLPLEDQIDHDIPKKFLISKKLKGFLLLSSSGKKLIHNDNFYYHSTTQFANEH